MAAITADDGAGAWRRTIAFLIDSLVMSVILLVCATALYPATGGRIQSKALARARCEALGALPDGIAVPSSLTPNFAMVCSYGLLGLSTAETVTVGRQTKDAPFEKTVSFTFMVDGRGRPVRGLSLDPFWFPLLLLLRWLTDLFGGTPGRRSSGIIVVGDDYDAPASGAKLLRRYAVFGLPFLVVWLTNYLLFSFFVTVAFLESAAFLPSLIIGLLLLSAPVILSYQAIRRGDDTFYDRAAGTAVVRSYLVRRVSDGSR